MFKDSSSSRTTLSGIPLPRFFTRSRTQRSSGRVKVWQLTPSFLPRDRSALTEGLNPSAVDGTTITFSLFSWAVRWPGLNDRNQARKERAWPKPEIKIGVLLGRYPAGRQALAIWAFAVVPAGLSLRGLDMSLDMRLLVVLASTAAYVALPRMGRVAGCRWSACSPVTDEFAGSGADPAPPAGRLLAGSINSP